MLPAVAYPVLSPDLGWQREILGPHGGILLGGASPTLVKERGERAEVIKRCERISMTVTGTSLWPGWFWPGGPPTGMVQCLEPSALAAFPIQS